MLAVPCSGTLRSTRTHGRMAFDGHLGALVLGEAARPAIRSSSGGATAGIRSRCPVAPPRGIFPGVAYHQRRQVLVVGGGDPSSSALFADTWEFDGTSWSRR